MIDRRRFVVLATCTALVAASPIGIACADEAGSFIARTALDLVAIVNSSVPLAEKQKRLRAVVDATVDVDEVARFCLGRFWRTASAEQQKTYVNLFHDVLVNDLTGKLGEYQGVKVTVGASRKHEDATIVSSIVERPNNPPAKVDWVVAQTANGPKIVDLVAEGTSLRLTQRSDYAAFVMRNNQSVEALLDALKQHLSQAGG